VVEENQRGINSPVFIPGPYSKIQEDGVIQFVDGYAGLIESRLLGTAAKSFRDVA
jgi:stachydrine N-demethylase